ncbi:DUF1905 domain-containing protein [Rhizobium sp. AG855]|uniref:DUF1905 domain-containing protein n=1 Tax=Rhizobium sp. AG855 TaxID=2183898 RepID=UPI000E76F6D0|nr:DUF1905 domain-containing protein [Rhizobium sp. AG855]RKE83995.1 uncharacterized protein DUF1905 [Rhizobium sp. AG855]
MSEPGHEIRFEAEVIRFNGPGGWHGVFLPVDAASEVRFFGRATALGAIAVRARIGASDVKTSLFPDKRRDSYLLPLKASLRHSENIGEGDLIKVTLHLDL